MKTVLMAAALCALAGLANSASAASCSEGDGKCQAGPINANTDRLVSLRCTITKPGPDLGNCKVVEAANGREAVNFNFRGDTGLRAFPVPTTGAYRCVVEAVGPNVGRVFCSIT